MDVYQKANLRLWRSERKHAILSEGYQIFQLHAYFRPLTTKFSDLLKLPSCRHLGRHQSLFYYYYNRHRSHFFFIIIMIVIKPAERL